MPRRARDRRHNPLQALTARIDRATGGPCIALRILDTDGKPAMLLMGDGCLKCTEFRAAIPLPPPPPTPTQLHDPIDDEEEERS